MLPFPSEGRGGASHKRTRVLPDNALQRFRFRLSALSKRESRARLWRARGRWWWVCRRRALRDCLAVGEAMRRSGTSRRAMRFQADGLGSFDRRGLLPPWLFTNRSPTTLGFRRHLAPCLRSRPTCGLANISSPGASEFRWSPRNRSAPASLLCTSSRSITSPALFGRWIRRASLQEMKACYDENAVGRIEAALSTRGLRCAYLEVAFGSGANPRFEQRVCEAPIAIPLVGETQADKAPQSGLRSLWRWRAFVE